MPELPEVETVRRGLAPMLIGRRLALVESRRGNLRFPLPDRFCERLMGQKIERLDRRAKYLVACLSGGEALVMHLGMTGRFTLANPEGEAKLGDYIYESDADPRHDHIIFHIAGLGRVIYNDPRRFGFMLLVPARELALHPLFSNLGPEPLGEDFDPHYLANRAATRKVNLKSLLMDQRVAAGLGNIYVCEALFRAGLSPNRPAKSLRDRWGQPTERAGHLVDAIKSVLRDAIAAGGSTLNDYRNAEGGEGRFQEAFRVYGRAGLPCTRAGCDGRIKRTVHTGRATFYCPRCQK